MSGWLLIPKFAPLSNGDGACFTGLLGGFREVHNAVYMVGFSRGSSLSPHLHSRLFLLQRVYLPGKPLQWFLALIKPMLCLQVSMEFPGPGISLVPSPTGLVRKVMRRITLLPARREHQKVSAADLSSPPFGAAAPADCQNQ